MDEPVRLTPAQKAFEASKKPAPKPWERPAGATHKAPEGITAIDLMAKEFQPIPWVVEGLIGPGLSILAGKPKQGKSWLSLQTAWAIACGAPIDGRATNQGEVLYLALEDTQRRLQGRLQMLAAELVPMGWVIPETLTLATEWPRMGKTAAEMGLVFVAEWLEKHGKNARWICIDTMAKFRTPQSGKGNSYAEDYEAASNLKDLVDLYNSSAQYVHHTRKMRADDPFDEISGTNGIAGAADTLMILENEKGRQRLFIRGRDVAEGTIDMEFKKGSGRWVLGPTREGIDTAGRNVTNEGGGKTLVEQCQDWLIGFLAKEAYPSKEIEWAAMSANPPFTFSTLRTAKDRLGRKGTGEIVTHNFASGGAADWWSGIGPPVEWSRRKVPILNPRGTEKPPPATTNDSPIPP